MPQHNCNIDFMLRPTTSTFRTILDQIRNTASSEKDKGTRFEELMRQYFLHDPINSEQFSEVWHWNDWTGRGNEADTGIDLVAKNKYDDGYTAIQCKFYAETAPIQREDIDSFLVRSGKKPFTHRIIVSTTSHWGKHAESVIHGQTIPVQRLDINVLEQSAIDWSQFDINKPKVKLKPKKKLREHQIDALDKVRDGFKTGDRGQLIMACGTGKTFTSLKIAEDHAGKNGLVLFLVPSLSLLSQTLREWTAEAAIPLHCCAVCSDTKIGKHDDTDPTTPDDLAISATTDGKTLAKSLGREARIDKMTVVFSTYQSIEAIHEAQSEYDMPEFDIIICDEAHRTTGAKLEGTDESHFVRVHDSEFIKGKKRLYMTATPRLYSAESKTKAKERDVPIWSMDNEEYYGKVFYYLGFSTAVSQGLLSDYKVVILGVDEHIAPIIEAAASTEKKKELPLVDPAKIIGCWNALAGKYDDGRKPILHRAVAFTTSIKQSQTFQSQFAHIVAEYHKNSGDKVQQTLHCVVEHVDGTMNALERNGLLNWLKEEPDTNECRVLTNARCLSEGVDVPALDAVMFLTPRKSKVDVVQSVGRVMRKAEGKDYGYVIIPIVIKAGTKPEDALSDSEAYEMVWGVLQALRAHDDRFQNEINVFELDGKEPEKIVISFIGKGTGASVSNERQITPDTQILGFSYEDIKLWKNALYATLVKKCGEKRYWEDWAKDVAALAQKHIATLEKLADDETHRCDFMSFLEHLRSNLNDSITEKDAIEMLAQHIITKPVFDALFDSDDFSKNNPVSQALDKVVALLEDVVEERAADCVGELDDFYESVRTRVAGVKTAEGRQKIIIELYDKFFKTAFPKLSEKLGIVYTPVEVVDFIIKSVDQALRQEFGEGIGAKDVHVLDPFTGTGTFIVRLLQSGLIAPKDLKRKYHEELHANELVLLAYYIAAINIGSTYHEVAEEQHRAALSYTPFPGIVHTDTFTMTQEKKLVDDANSKRAKKQKNTPITVIIGNPPYSMGQQSQNDANKNTQYPDLDKRIRETYADTSVATNKNRVYDSYIRAFRWASDRIGKKGIVCYVSNASYIDGNAMDGLRKSLADEFTDIYCFNLRGNARTSGEERRKEKGNVFGEGTRTPVAIMLLIKNPAKKHPGTVHYHDIGDYLDRNEKLKIITNADGVHGISWQIITPNEKYDWINQRGDVFNALIPIGDNKNNETDCIFSTYSCGLQTARDAWCYNFSSKRLSQNIREMIEFYNNQVERYAFEKSIMGGEAIDVDRFVDNDPTKISWTQNLKKQLARETKGQYESKSIICCDYRPFCKQFVYMNRFLNERVFQIPQIFPDTKVENLIISVSGIGGSKFLTPLIHANIMDLNLQEANGRCFPLYTYELAENKSMGLIETVGERVGDYVRKENISDAVLQKFRDHYGDRKITKEDIFYYVYGILHSKSYRERFASDLKKQLPRVPMVDDFWTFSKSGRKLAELHLNYETGEMYPLVEKTADGRLQTAADYKITQMRYASKTDKSTIIYNAQLHLAGIPAEAYQYVVNGKSALDWIIERYAVTTHKDSGIKNDPNDWCAEIGNDRYIVDLVKRIVTLSVESVKIIDGLPEVRF